MELAKVGLRDEVLSFQADGPAAPVVMLGQVVNLPDIAVLEAKLLLGLLDVLDNHLAWLF